MSRHIEIHDFLRNQGITFGLCVEYTQIDNQQYLPIICTRDLGICQNSHDEQDGLYIANPKKPVFHIQTKNNQIITCEFCPRSKKL